MKVILTQDVRGKGKRGQMIEVSDGYARNFLLPKKLAQEANADNINTMRMNDKATQERQAKERAEAMEISKKMKDMTVVVMAKGGGAGKLFGSVTNAEIAEALEKQEGIALDKRRSSSILSKRPVSTPPNASSAMKSPPTSSSRCASCNFTEICIHRSYVNFRGGEHRCLWKSS